MDIFLFLKASNRNVNNEHIINKEPKLKKYESTEDFIDYLTNNAEKDSFNAEDIYSYTKLFLDFHDFGSIDIEFIPFSLKKSFLSTKCNEQGVVKGVALNLPVFLVDKECQKNDGDDDTVNFFSIFEDVLKSLLDIHYKNPKNFIAYLKRKYKRNVFNTKALIQEVQKYFQKRRENVVVIGDTPNIWHFYLKNTKNDGVLYLQQIEEADNKKRYFDELLATLLEI